MDAGFFGNTLLPGAGTLWTDYLKTLDLGYPRKRGKGIRRLILKAYEPYRNHL